MSRVALGTEEHKQRFCREFIATHERYSADELQFPEIDSDSLVRLKGLPIWDEAVNTERETAAKVQRMAYLESDPLMSEAIALQGFEEGRHAALLDRLTKAYGIPVQHRADQRAVTRPVWDFTRTEYGECFDAFFAFGLFKFAKDSGFFPEPLVKLFDPIMQEEARHVMFFVNWMAHKRANLNFLSRPWLDFQRALAVSLQILSRIRTAFDLGGSEQDNFAMNSHASFGEFTLRSFLQTCLEENDRRLGGYDPGLLRPNFVPRMARIATAIMPR